MASEGVGELTQDVAQTRGQWLESASPSTRSTTSAPASQPTPPPIAGQTAPAATPGNSGATATPTTQGTPQASQPPLGAPIGGRATNPLPNGRASSSQWTIDPKRGVLRDGRDPTLDDLRSARDEWVDIPPGTIEGFEQDELLARPGSNPNLAGMRAALRQGFSVNGTQRIPYFVNDVPKSRMVDDVTLPAERKQAGARFIDAQGKRIEKYGEPEIERVLRDLQNSKYRGVKGNTQPYEVWWDHQRLAVADALRASKWDGPVHLGFRHKFDPSSQRYITDTSRPIVINPASTAKPVLRIDQYEPDANLWMALQRSAAQQGNPDQFRVITPPATQSVPSSVTQAQPPSRTALLTRALATNPAQTTPAAGLQRGGTAPSSAPATGSRTRLVKAGFETDEFDGLLVAEGHKPLLRTPVGDRTLYRVIADTQDDIRHLAQQARQGGNLDPAMAKEYSQLSQDLYGRELDFAAMTSQELDIFAANASHKRWLDALPAAQKRASNGLGAQILQANSDVASFRSAMGLHNWATAPRQLVVQTTGNMWSLLLNKPSALTQFLDPRRWKAFADAAKQARQGAKGPFTTQAKSSSMQSMERMGLGVNSMIASDVKSLSADSVRRGINAPWLRAIKDKLAPEVLRDWVSIPDAVTRDALAAADFFPQVRKLQQRTGKEAAALAHDWVKRGKLSVPPNQVRKAIDGAMSAHYGRQSRVSEISAVELEQAILKQFEGASNKTGLVQFADRIARDYKTHLNTIYQQAARETRRVAFSWDATRLDDGLRHAFLYHYWTSRASGLYLRNMVQNPWVAASFVRMAQGAYEEAQANDYPLWMQGFGRLLSSPVGSVLMANPFSMFSAMLFFADWQYGMEPSRIGEDLTKLGQIRGIFPLMINPLWDSFAWGLGLYGGEDAARMVNEPTGAERIPRDLIRILNTARLNGHLPPGMLSDEFGNPALLGERPMTELWAKFASAVTGVVRENPQPVPNLYASLTSAEQAHLLDIIVEDHPEWTEDMVTREMNRQILAADTGPASDQLVEAQKRALEAQMRGPEFSWLPEGIRGVVGVALRHVSPMQMQARPEMATALRKTPYGALGRPQQALPEMQDSYDKGDMASAIYDTPEMTSFNIASEDWWGDPALNTAYDEYKAIRDATNPNGEVVQGVHYSQEQIMAMTDHRRFKLAREALGEHGFDMTDVEAQFRMRDQLELANVDLAAFKGYQDAAKAHPGGIEGFVDEMYESDPAFKRMMDQVPYEQGSDDWYGAFDWEETFFGTAGNKTSNYDPQVVPEGEIPVSQYAADREAALLNEEDKSYTAKTERSVNELMLAQDLLDEQFPGYGLEVGRGNLDYGVWSTMKPVWEAAGIDTRFITKPDQYGRAYLDWVAANPDAEDISVQAYLDATMTDDGSNKFADGTLEEEELPVEQAPVNLDAPLDYERALGRFGIQRNSNSTAGAQIATLDMELSLRSSPGGAAITNVPSGLPLRILATEGDWSRVWLPGGFEGWVPTVNLKKAA
jgi:hypothetical protein